MSKEPDHQKVKDCERCGAQKGLVTFAIGGASADVCMDCAGDFEKAADSIARAILEHADRFVSAFAGILAKTGTPIESSARLRMRAEAAAYFLHLCDRVAFEELGPGLREVLGGFAVEIVVAGLQKPGRANGSLRQRYIDLINQRQVSYASAGSQELNWKFGEVLTTHVETEAQAVHVLGVGAMVSALWLRELSPLVLRELEFLVDPHVAIFSEIRREREQTSAATELEDEEPEGDPLSEALAFAVARDVKRAVPALLDILERGDIDEIELAAAALAKLGRQAVPGLIRMLEHEDALVRWQVLDALGEIGGHASEAIPRLAALLEASDPATRFQAAEAIMRIDRTAHTEAVVPILIEALRDPHDRIGASVLLQVAGPAAKAAIPTLVELIKGEGDEHQILSLALQAVLRNAGRTLLPTAIELMWDRDPRIRRAAVGAMQGMGQEAVPFLVSALADDDPHVRQSASYSLCRIGRRAWPAFPALVARLRDSYVRRGIGLAFKHRTVRDGAQERRNNGRI